MAFAVGQVAVFQGASDAGSDFTFQRGKERFAPSDVLRPERREER
jgi:hypothetical protein